MAGYLGQFMVYTIAMVGLIFAALMVYKKVAEGCGFGTKSDFLNVEDSISLSPRKNLYVIRAGKQRFLVASDIDRTTLISELDEDDNKEIPTLQKEKRQSIEELPTIVDFQKNKKPSVIRKIVDGVKSNDIDIEIVE